MNISKSVQSITAILVLIGMIFGGYFYLDARYAKAETLKKVEQRLDQKIEDDRKWDIRKQLWHWEEKFGERLERAGDEIKKQYRELKQMLEDMEKDAKDG